MTEYLEACHLCGHMMASSSPICPGCFAKADPAARQRLRVAIQAEIAASDRQRREKQKEELANQNELNTYLVLCFVGLLVIILIAAFSSGGR